MHRDPHEARERMEEKLKGAKANGHGGTEEATGAPPHDTPWGTPEPLAEPQEPPPAFPLAIMGAGWGNWCATQAAVASAPVDFVAIPLLALGGTAIANTRWGCPKPGWREPPVLNVGLVGLPSSGKSPALDMVHGPLAQAERELGRGSDEIRRDWLTAKASAEACNASWLKDVKTAVVNGHPAPSMPAGAVVPPEPRAARLFTSNATVEALADILAHEPKGIAIVCDELASLIGNMDRYGGNGGDRAFWLAANGGRPHVVDRVKNGGLPTRVPHLSIAVVGGIQPDRLRTMLLSGDDDGLAARFCFVWPGPVDLQEATPSPAPERLVTAILALRGLPMATDPATGDTFPAYVPFTRDGASALHAFRVRCRAAEHDTSGTFCGWLGKSPGRVVRTACILEHLWWAWDSHGGAAPPAEISADAVTAAIHLVEDYLTPHAERVFDEAGLGGADAQMAKDAEMLARWVKARTDDKGVPPTREQAAQSAPRRLRDAPRRNAALVLLTKRHWLRTEKRAGAPSVLVLNPALGWEA